MSTDTPQNESQNEISSNGDSATEGRRLRSTIAFPYGSLKDAEQIAGALNSSWGGGASPDQLAGTMDSTPRSGAFRVKVATARIFGAVDVTRGKISLTDLGHRLIDAQTQEAARVEAFLTVPLFKAIYDEYEGRTLPPDTGLEQKIADLGVSPKQTAKARQALQRSADRAGFFKTTPGRLVRPAPTGDSGKPSNTGAKSKNVNQPQSGAIAVPLAHLWLMLLDEGESWSAETTQEFVKKARELREILGRES